MSQRAAQVPNTSATETETAEFNNVSMGIFCTEYEKPDEEIERLDLIKVKMSSKNRKQIEMLALPDTGSNITAISPKLAQSLGAKYIEDDSIKPTTSADGSHLKTIGKVTLKVEFFNKIVETVAFVIDGLKKPILSKQLLKKFKLIHEDFPFAQVNHVKHLKTPIVKLTAQRSRSRSNSSTRKPFYFKLK